MQAVILCVIFNNTIMHNSMFVIDDLYLKKNQTFLNQTFLKK